MMNSTSVIGRWTKDAELRYLPDGKAVVSGTLAVQRSFKNQQGDYDADFINIVIYGPISETIANRTEKGGRFGGVGRIQTRSYDNQEGKRIYITEVVIEKVTMIDWKNTGQNNNGSSQNSGQQNNQYNRSNSANEQWTQNGAPEISDDDLPF